MCNRDENSLCASSRDQTFYATQVETRTRRQLTRETQVISNLARSGWIHRVIEYYWELSPGAITRTPHDTRLCGLFIVCWITRSGYTQSYLTISDISAILKIHCVDDCLLREIFTSVLLARLVCTFVVKGH